jgi:acyl-CoA thioesterase-1
MRLSLTGLLFFSAVALLGCGGDSASSTPRPRPAPAAAPAETLPKIVAFGDSLTAGFGLNPKQSYPALLQQKLDADGYKYEVVNAGVSGDTSAGGLRRLDWSLEGGDVRFLILELGANDFLRGQPVRETRRNLSQIIERAKSRGVRVLLAGMYTTTNSGNVYLREIDETFKSLASEHDVPLIPFFLENVAGVQELNLDDGVHPNAEGTKIVADTVYKYLKPLLEEEKERVKG